MPTTKVETEQFPRGYVSGGGLVPVPDPTALTTAQLNLAIDSLQELLETKINGGDLLLDEKVKSLKELMSQLSVANSTAISAALQAGKELVAARDQARAEAITKSETATAESIRQLQALFNSSVTAINGQVNDIKARLDRGEGTTKGAVDMRGMLIAGVMSLVAIGALVISVFSLLKP